MNIHMLGTGGADGVPAFYGDSRVSEYARTHGGRDVRTRSAALIDGVLKLDLGPDTWHQITRDKLDARDWTALLFTHSDADHFAIDELQYSLYPFNDMEFAGFTIYANGVICRRILERYPDWPFEIVMTQSYVPFEHCSYRVSPFQATHMSGEDAQNFIISDGDKTMLYGTDTGIWIEPAWEYLQDFRLDALVLECSEGIAPTDYYGHLSVEEFLQVIERLRKQGTIDDRTQIITTHHSHNGEATHAELEAIFAAHGVQVGYDGLVVTV